MSKRSPSPTQIGLFDSLELAKTNAELRQQIAALREGHQEWARVCKDREAERDHAIQELAKTTTELLQQIALLTAQNRSWELCHNLLTHRLEHLEAGGAFSKDILTHLLTIVHPDKWENKPASALAHELAIAINQVRSRQGGKHV